MQYSLICIHVGSSPTRGSSLEQKVSRLIWWCCVEYILNVHYMIKSCTCICKGRQDKVRHSPKADSEKNTELPRTGFEPVITGLLVQCSANMYMYIAHVHVHVHDQYTCKLSIQVHVHVYVKNMYMCIVVNTYQ